MNNQMPFPMPYNYQPNFMKDPPNHDLERIINKLNRLEKNLRILENRITKLEGNHKKGDPNYFEDPTDMYII